MPYSMAWEDMSLFLFLYFTCVLHLLEVPYNWQLSPDLGSLVWDDRKADSFIFQSNPTYFA